MKRNQNHKLIRLTKDVLCAYQNVRLAEIFNDVDPTNAADRAQFIRSWVLNKRELTPFESQFFHEQLVVKQKSFALRWSEMEARIMNMSDVANTWSDYDDATRLKKLFRDLASSGYHTEFDSIDELTLSNADSRKVLSIGLIAAGTIELKNMMDGWIDETEGLVLNIQCPKVGPYIAIQDAIQIAGFNVLELDKFKPNTLLSVRISTSRQSELTPLLKNISFPAALRRSAA